MASASTKKNLKGTALYPLVVLAGLTILVFALYIPIWNNNVVMLCVVSALIGVQFVMNLKKGFGTAFFNLVANSVLMFALWGHNVPLIVVTAIAFFIYAIVSVTMKRRRARLYI